ncbi:MAG: hypothetical protein GQ477_01640 [Nanohaloarchaea archaeon]|nr:hypothetical protein [Candidatus Nanohaloarchaea archaeon]
MQYSVIEHIRKGLIKRDFEIIQFERYCFDIAAKKRDTFILVKILKNVDSFSSEQAEDLKRMASVLSASPIICAIQGRNFHIACNSVYERFGIYVVHPETFLDSLDLELPFILSKKGKNTVNIDTSHLKSLRHKLDMSFNKMSNALGISKKTIYLAEKTGRTSDYVVSAMESFFDEVIRQPIDIFSSDVSSQNHEKTSFERKVTGLTSRLGYSDFVFQTAPAKVVLKKKDMILMCDAALKLANDQKASDLESLSHFCDVSSFIIVKDSQVLNVRGIAVVRVDEIKKMKSKAELLELIYGRS